MSNLCHSSLENSVQVSTYRHLSQFWDPHAIAALALCNNSIRCKGQLYHYQYAHSSTSHSWYYYFVVVVVVGIAVVVVVVESFGLVTERRHDMRLLCAVSHMFACLLDVPCLCAPHSFHRRMWYSALSLCCVRAMHVFDIQASSLPRRGTVNYFCAKFCFCCGFRC